MLHILLRILPLVVGGLVVKELVSSGKQKVTLSSNNHSNFLRFNRAISISESRKAKLVESRRSLEKQLIRYFKTNQGLTIPKFYIQGSFKMQTLVVKKDGSYDVDLGVYFLEKPKLSASTIQRHVANAVFGATLGGTEHRDKCIRVIYRGEYDIDLPAYYMSANDEHPYLATKKGWMKSDPKELCDWFVKQQVGKEKEQMLRIVKYFKAWSYQSKSKMPSGIAFSTWVARFYRTNLSDDVAFYETAVAIKKSFSWATTSVNPATPGDDFLSKLSGTQINNFEKALGQLIVNAKKALAQDDELSAARIWIREFGNKFTFHSSFRNLDNAKLKILRAELYRKLKKDTI